MSDSHEGATRRGGVTSIEITPEQFDQLREQAGYYLLQALDYVDITDGRTYRVRKNDYIKGIYYEEVSNGD